VTHGNLLTPPTRLPEDPAAVLLARGDEPARVAAAYPASCAAWATLAENALAAGRSVEAYAYARTGYHRGLDALRRSGWKGSGPVPWSHEPRLPAGAARARPGGRRDRRGRRGGPVQPVPHRQRPGRDHLPDRALTGR
jgi:hypothetical protein